MSDAEIEAAKSPAGGWTRETLAKWGVPWPPPKGWRKALVNGQPVPPALDVQPVIDDEMIPVPPVLGSGPGILDIALGILSQMQAVADELRAERRRHDAQQAQLAMEVARLRNAVDALEVIAAASAPRACTCPPRGVYAVLQGGYCPDCMGRV